VVVLEINLVGNANAVRRSLEVLAVVADLRAHGGERSQVRTSLITLGGLIRRRLLCPSQLRCSKKQKTQHEATVNKAAILCMPSP
jgi:hypothetical protein